MREPRDRYWRKAMVWAALALASYVFWRWLVWYLLPFVLAGVLAFLVNPWVDRMQSWGLKRALAVLVALGSALAGFLAVCGAILTLLTAEVLQISHRLPAYLKARPFEVGRYLDEWNRLRAQVGLGPGNLSEEVGSLYRLVAGVARVLAHGLVQLPGMALILLVSALAAFFVLRDQRLVRNVAERAAPPAWRGRLGPFSSAMAGGLFGYIRAEFALVALTGLVTMGGLVIIGAPYAVLVGLTAGLLDMVPFMGPTMLLVPWAVGATATGNLSLALRLLVVLAVVAVIRQTVEPRLVGRGTGLHPLVVLFSLYMGVRLFGAGGVLAGPVTAVMFKAIVQAMHSPKGIPPKAG